MLPNGTILSHADDTAVISSRKTWIDVQKIMNEYLTKVNAWLSVNQLSFNINKSVFVTFGSTDKSLPFNIEIKITLTKKQK